MAKYDNVYSLDFNIKKLKPAEKNKLITKDFYEFPVAAAVILHIITFGLFSIIYYGIIHGKCPKLLGNDFGTGKAIGFMFIPFFNLYWIFMFWLRLTDKVNLQLKLRNKSSRISKGFVIGSVILCLIPYLNYVGLFIFLSIVVGSVQSHLNKIAKKY